MKRAVVFGATGLVGRNVVEQLLSNDLISSVTIVARREVKISHSKLKCLILSDFSDLDNHAEFLCAEIYFVCTGTTIKKAGSKDNFFKTDHDIPLKIARLAERLNVPVLSVISSIGADSRSGNFYLKTKGIMENSLKEAYEGDLQIMRPSLLLGKREEFRPAEFAGVILFKALGWLMVGPVRKYRGVEAGDVASLMIQGALNSKSFQ